MAIAGAEHHVGGRPLRLALIGAGAMGAHHARVIVDSARALVEVVVDADLGRATRVAEMAGARPSTDLSDAFRCDAAIVATATAAHAGVAMALLAEGVPTLVEKPLADDLDDTRKLLAESQRRGVPLTCGFVERFNPVVQCAAALLDEPPLHVMAVRHSPPNERATASVVYDLLIHDIDLAVGLLAGAEPAAVHAALWVPPGGTVSELADATLHFAPFGSAAGAVATLSASRAGQRKTRQITVTTSSALLEIDLLRQDVTVYRHVRHEVMQDTPTYRSETIVDIPFVRHAGEPLGLQLDHFLDLACGRADADAERRSLIVPHVVAAAVEAASSEPSLAR